MSVFDPRTKLLNLLLINIMVFISSDTQTEWLCVGAVIIMLIAMGCFHQALYGLLIYTSMVMILYLCGFADNFLVAFISMTVICFRKIVPIVLFASGLMTTTKISELISAMQKMHIPKVIVIPLAVMFRFFPTAKEEYTAIREAARLRGLSFSVERTLIPMMLRCANIAEELSASCVTRGIESSKRRTSMHEIQFKKADFLAVTIFILLTIFVFMGGISLVYG